MCMRIYVYKACSSVDEPQEGVCVYERVCVCVCLCVCMYMQHSAYFLDTGFTQPIVWLAAMSASFSTEVTEVGPIKPSF